MFLSDMFSNNTKYKNTIISVLLLLTIGIFSVQFNTSLCDSSTLTSIEIQSASDDLDNDPPIIGYSKFVDPEFNLIPLFTFSSQYYFKKNSYSSPHSRAPPRFHFT